MHFPRSFRRFGRSKSRKARERRRHPRGFTPAVACERLEERTLLSAVGHGDFAGAASDQTREIGISPVVDEERIPPVDEDRIANEIPTSQPVPPFDLGETFQLHSNPGATKVIYLDFDGHTTTGTAWSNNVNPGSPIVTPAYSFEGDGSSNFTDGELERIQKIWQRVAEDFIPFDVNVTTEDPGAAALQNSGGGDNEWGVRLCIGGSWSDWYGSSAGGVAYVGVFDSSGGLYDDAPAFVFEDNTGNGDEKSTAEAISHETGHTLGLFHDDTSEQGYYEGHGSGATGWAPIMGVGYYEQLTQWSRGEYSDANNTEDDLQIITTQNGFGYRSDDHGDTDATASAATWTGDTLEAAGIIERNDDVDVFSFTTSGGQLDLNVLPFVNSPNLDVLAELYDSAGSLVASSNPLNTLNASFDLTLAAGEYFLRIDGTGKGDPLATGYTDYGSLGAYTITGTLGSPQRFDSTDVSKQIPNVDTITSTLTINDDLVIDDLNVGLDIGHGDVTQLDVFLIGPDGTRVELFTDVGDPFESNFTNTVLDDEAPSITGGSAPFTGSFAPEGSLADFDGRLTQGTWTLEITDDETGVVPDGGILNSWFLSILPQPDLSLTVTVSPSTVDETDGTAATTGTVTRTGGDFSRDLIVHLTSGDPSEVSVPATVTILAGQDSANFNIDTVDDNLIDGTQSVIITATAGGSLVSSSVYGTNGVATVDMSLQDSVLQSDGKLLVVGYRNDTSNPDFDNDLVVARFNTDGTLDASFGTNGVALIEAIDGTDRIENGITIALQSDGKILVGGELFTFGDDNDKAGFLMRLDATGQIDSTFGSGGQTIFDPTIGLEKVWDLLVLPDDSILTAGEYQGFAALYRFDSDGGQLTFPDGSTHLPVLTVPSDDPNPAGVGDDATTLLRQPDGKILVGGVVYGDYPGRVWGIARLTADFQYDSTFGADGRIITDLPTTTERLEQILLQSDGKIVAVGGGGDGTYGIELRALARYNTDGSLDQSFGDGGTVLTPSAEDDAIGYAAHLLPDGSILVAGRGGASAQGLLTRYTADGMLIQGATALLHDLSGRSIVETADGSILVAGLGGDVEKFTAFDFATASGSLNVTDDDTAPQAVDDTVTTDEDTAVTIDVLANDTDADGDALLLTSVTNMSGGTVEIHPDDMITFTPDAGYTGPAGFSYTIRDEDSQTSMATVSITVEDANEPPTVDSLTVTISPSTISEPDGTATGTVTHTGDLSQDIVVQLESSDTSEATVPATVTILAGQDSANFTINVVDDSLEDGTQTVTITASAAGSSTQITLDGTFGAAGHVDTRPAVINDVAEQSDGKIVVTGYYFKAGGGDDSQDYYVARYNADGTLDASFGNNGEVIINSGSNGDIAHAVAIQSDGKIVIAGRVQQSDTNNDFAVIRLNADGSFDTTFGATGFNVYSTGSGRDVILDLEILANGDILAAGAVDVDDVRYTDFALMRINGDGSIDTAFGNGGLILTNFQTGEAIRAIDVQDDGKIVAVGTQHGGNFDSQFAIARYTADGQLDSTFGTGGQVRTDLPDNYYEGANDVVIQDDGKIVVVGYAGGADEQGNYIHPPPYDFALVRYNTDGTLDNSFGTGGISVSDFGGDDDTPSAVTLLSDGRILVAGRGTVNQRAGIALFGTDGALKTSIFSAETVGSHAYAMTILNDGSVLIGGPHDTSTGGYLERYAVVDEDEVVTATDTVNVENDDILNEPPVANDDSYSVAEDGTLTVSGTGTPILDQENFRESGRHVFHTGFFSLQQQVRAGESGQLTSVDVFIDANSDPGDVLNLFVSLGGPWQNDTPDFQTQITVDSSDIDNWVTIDVSSANIVLQSGDFFTIGTFEAGSSGVSLHTTNSDFGGDSYADGSLWVDGALETTPGGNDYDLLFRTRVAPAASGGLLANDSDPDGDPLTAQLVSGPAHGSLTLNADGSFTYTPDADYAGPDSFTYTANDGELDSNVATVSITVAPDHATPESLSITYETPPPYPFLTEASGTTIGTITRTGDLSGDVVIQLTSSNPSKLSVPETVTIAAGQASADFTITLIDDNILSGDEFITLTATAGSDAPGALTPNESFGSGGLASTPLTFNWQPPSAVVATLPSGKVLAASEDETAGSWRLVRLNADGTLDASFGTDGSVVTAFTGSNGAVPLAIFVQGDGKILIGGESINESPGSAILARYNSDGTLDTSFFNGGINTLGGTDGWVSDIAMHSDGKIYLSISGNSGFDFKVVRLTSGGFSDGSFGSGGVRIYTGTNAWAAAISLTSDGGFYLAGDNKVGKFDANGNQDFGFGSSGIATVDFGSPTENVVGLEQLPDGRIVVGYYLFDGDDTTDFGAARLNADGTLDTTFSGDGLATIDFGGLDDYASSMDLQNDGKIILAGYTEVNTTEEDWAIARLDIDGSLDSTFDDDGLYTQSTRIGADRIFDIAISGPKLVALGGWADNMQVAGYELPGVTVSAERNIFVADQEELTVSVNQTTFTEGAPVGVATMTITRENTNIDEALVVTPVTGINGQIVEGFLILPETVTIAAGESSVTFDIGVADDVYVNGTREFQIAATATNYFPNIVMATVADDDLGAFGADNILVATDGPSEIREYTPAGTLVRVFSIPELEGEFKELRDLAVDTDGNLHFWEETFDASLARRYELTTLDPTTGTLTREPLLPGWSTVNNGTYGGVATLNDFVFVTDMATSGASQSGMIRYDRSTGTSVRFADTDEFIDLTIGLDGLLYGLDEFELVHVYDPATLAKLRTVNITQSVFPDNRAIAVNASGDIFAAAWGDDRIRRFDGETGELIATSTSTFGSLVDINLAADGTIVASTRFNGISITDETLATNTNFALDGDVSSPFVAFAATPPTVNLRPFANDSSVSTDEDTAHSGSVTASDPESQPLTYALATDVTHGTLVINPDGTFTYTPDEHYFGTDSFTYTVSDGNSTSNTATVDITVIGVNDAPTFPDAPFDFAIDENTPAGTTVGTASAQDVDGQNLSYTITDGNASGAFAINAATGEITVADPAQLDFESTESFSLTVRATDAMLADETTVVVISLNDVVAPHVANIEYGYGDNQWADADDLADRTAAWQVTKVRVSFTEDVTVDINDLVIAGTNGTYAISDFDYNDTTFTATWTLTSPIEQDRVTMNLDWESGGAAAMTTSESSAAIEDNLAAELDVLFGDYDGNGAVDLFDAVLQRSLITTSDPWADINGDGVVDLFDAVLLRTRISTSLPSS